MRFKKQCLNPQPERYAWTFAWALLRAMHCMEFILESYIQPKKRQATRHFEISYCMKHDCILCLHDLSSLSPKFRFLARSGPPFVLRGIPIQWERSGLQMADLNERENGVGGERSYEQNIALDLLRGIEFFTHQCIPSYIISQQSRCRREWVPPRNFHREGGIQPQGMRTPGTNFRRYIQPRDRVLPPPRYTYPGLP